MGAGNGTTEDARLAVVEAGMIRIEQGITTLTGLIGEMRDAATRDNEKLQTANRSIEVLFQKHRDCQDKEIPKLKEALEQYRNAAVVRAQEIEEKLGTRLTAIEVKHLKEEGAAAAFKDIRVLVPSVIATILAILQLMDKVSQWLHHPTP